MPMDDQRFGKFETGEPRFVSAAYKDLDDAIAATRDLEEHGYPTERISIVMDSDAREQYIETHPRYGELEKNAVVVEEVELQKGSRAAEGAGVGGALGGALGAAGAAVAAAGTTLVIPPLGIALAGPVAAALAGLGAGAATGGVVGALVGAGMSEYRAQQFQRLIKEGRVIVGVTAGTVPERNNILEILEEHGGKRVPAEGAA